MTQVLRMRVALIVLIAVTIATALPHHQNGRIVGGSVTSIAEYPYAVALLYRSGSFWYQDCGGTILNSRSILTAAHCFIYSGIHSVRSRVGSTYSDHGGWVYESADIIKHPEYDGYKVNDFAILRVVGPIVWVPNAVAQGSIAGANYPLADDEEVWPIGWGNLEFLGPRSNELRHVQVWTVNQEECVRRYAERRDLVTESMLCTGWLDVGTRDHCHGDSGGPVLHRGTVVGIVSWGHRCADPFVPGVNARVTWATNWIVANA